jgi:hypothetical protein
MAPSAALLPSLVPPPPLRSGAVGLCSAVSRRQGQKKSNGRLRTKGRRRSASAHERDRKHVRWTGVRIPASDTDAAAAA